MPWSPRAEGLDEWEVRSLSLLVGRAKDPRAASVGHVHTCQIPDRETSLPQRPSPTGVTPSPPL